jgi:hypothetical protein
VLATTTSAASATTRVDNREKRMLNFSLEIVRERVEFEVLFKVCLILKGGCEVDEEG